MKNKKILTLIFLCVIMSALIIPRFLGRGPGSARKDETAPGGRRTRRSKKKEVTIKKLSPEEMRAWLEEREKFIYRPENRRDPFNPLVFSTKDPGSTGGSGITLKGILWDPTDPLAEIEISGCGTRIIHIGDLIKGCKVIPKDEAGDVPGGKKVLDIQKEMIILQEGTRKIPIKLK